MKTIITILTALMLICSTAWAGDVCLEWDANTEPDLAGYRIFTKLETAPTYNYTTPAWEGIETTCSLDLEDGITWNLVARAYDNEVPSNESGDSNEVSYFSDFPWVNTPPAAVNLRVVDCGP